MSRFSRPALALILTASVSACATTGTPRGPAAPETDHAAQLEQQQVFITRDLRQQRRVDDVGYALLAAAAPFCPGALVAGTGVRFANIESFSSTYQDAARTLGFSDTLIIVSVPRASAAARAGLAVGDRVAGVNDGPAPRGPNAASLVAREIGARGTSVPSPPPPPPPFLALRRGDTTFLVDASARPEAPAPTAARASAGERRVSVSAELVCGYNLTASRKDEVHAWADGSGVTVTSDMLRLVPDNDELAAVLAHEIAHNALGHIRALDKTAMGGPFGAVVGTAATTLATNTTLERRKQRLDVGSLVFSQDQERDADDVAMYLLARAERPIAGVTGLWRHMAQQNPGIIKFATTHPTSRDRLLRLERAERDMAQKIARGEIPSPELPPAGDVTGAVESLSRYELSAGDSVSYTFGPAVPRGGLTLAEVRRRALEAYEDGNEALHLRLYVQAEDRYREAVLYDGSEARYHAALGAILLKRGKRAEAEAALSAAVLLDVDNAEYRRLLVEARQRER